MSWSKQEAVNNANNAVEEYRSQQSDIQQELYSNESALENYQQEADKTLTQIIKGVIQDNYSKENIKSIQTTFDIQQLSTIEDKLENKKEEVIKDIDSLSTQREEQVASSNVSELDELIISKDRFSDKNKIYRDDSFSWLYGHGVHQRKKEGLVRKIVKTLIGRYKQEKKNYALFEEKFSGSLQDEVNNYEGNQIEIDKLEKQINEINKVKKVLEDLESQIQKKKTWVDSFEKGRVDKIHEAIVNFFQNTEVTQWASKLNQPQRVNASKLHCINKKYEYTIDLIQYLQNEIQDKATRVANISDVSQKWSNSSKTSFENKTKWLCDIPSIKKKSTYTKLRHSNTLRDNLHYYDSYDIYDNLFYDCLESDNDFIAYELFNKYTLYPTAPFHFCSDVIEDLRIYNGSHQPSWIDETEFYENEDENGEYEETNYIDDTEDAILVGTAAYMLADSINDTAEMNAAEALIQSEVSEHDIS